jgi:CBS-domain-containing membrane protein
MNMPNQKPAPGAAVRARLTAGSLCRPGAITVSEDVDLATAARLLRDRNTHYLIVMDHCAPSRHQIIGIVSGHEIATSVVAREGDPRSITVGDVMIRPPLFLRSLDDAGVLPSLMREAGACCAPVLSEKGEIIGVLAMEDLLARAEITAPTSSARDSSREPARSRVGNPYSD